MDADDSKASAEQGQAAATAHLQHLPPISLAMSFHHNYPQQNPPGRLHRPLVSLPTHTAVAYSDTPCLGQPKHVTAQSVHRTPGCSLNLGQSSLAGAFWKAQATLCHAGMQLTAEWLSSEQADSLAQQLLGLWKEQGPGGPICFTWTDWLQNDALPFLGVTDTLLLTFDPHAVPAAEGDPDSLAAGEHLLEPCQQAAEPAAGSKPSADSLQSSGTVGQRLPHSNACQDASGSALTPRRGHLSSRQRADTPGAGIASAATSKQALQTSSGGEPGSQSSASNSDARRSGRRKHRGNSHRSPAQGLDPCAAAWQPQDSREAASLAIDPQPSHSLQKKALLPSQQTEQVAPATSAASPAAVHLNGRAKLSENTSSTHTAARDREDACHEPDPADSLAGCSSTAAASQPVSSKSDLERVVELYMHLTAYSKSRERELFQEASP